MVIMLAVLDLECCNSLVLITWLFSFFSLEGYEPVRVKQCCNFMIIFIVFLCSLQKRMNQSEFREVSTELMTVMSQPENMEDLTHFTLSAQIVENLAKNIQDKREVGSHIDLTEHRKLSFITIFCVFTHRFHDNCITYGYSEHTLYNVIILFVGQMEPRKTIFNYQP